MTSRTNPAMGGVCVCSPHKLDISDTVGQFTRLWTNFAKWDNMGEGGQKGLSGAMGLCPTYRTKRTKMDVWAQIWPLPYTDGKVHKSVIKALSGHLTVFQTMDDI